MENPLLKFFSILSSSLAFSGQPNGPRRLLIWKENPREREDNRSSEWKNPCSRERERDTSWNLWNRKAIVKWAPKALLSVTAWIVAVTQFCEKRNGLPRNKKRQRLPTLHVLNLDTKFSRENRIPFLFSAHLLIQYCQKSRESRWPIFQFFIYLFIFCKFKIKI